MECDSKANETQPYELEQAWRKTSGEDTGEKVQWEIVRSNGTTEKADFL